MKKAFTLIELLIVVAIIAILAAIAVPNFLEAQTRAKVSRVMADQRSYATALETYYIDNNTYPVYHSQGMLVGTGRTYTAIPTGVQSIHVALKTAAGQTRSTEDNNLPSFATSSSNTAIGLTTPVSFLSAYSGDAFAGFKQAPFAYSHGNAGFLLFSPGPDGIYDLDGGTGGTANSSEYIVSGGQSLPSPYLIVGPAGSGYTRPAGAPSSGNSFTYDATNGTGSPGDVYRPK